MKDGIRVHGTYRLQVDEGGKIVGDSGWCDNQVCNEGFLNYLVRAIQGAASSSQVSYIGLGTGTIPASNATTLAGEVQKRKAITTGVSGSTTARLTATFSSTDSFVLGNSNISNIGLFAAGTATTGGTIFAGNTYASSSVATNQNVNVTYDINFA